ncbi:hypothetical protein ACFE04_014695 [Oxalis oulophora]
MKNKNNKHKQQECSKKKTTTSQLWDCGSTLYDSFELKSFKRQLDSAIASSTSLSSMPHLPPPPSKMYHPSSSSSSSSRISRSFNRFLKSIFRLNKQKSRLCDHHQFYAVYDMSGALTTIPEVPEIDFGGGLSPDINYLLERSTSERLTSATSNIGTGSRLPSRQKLGPANVKPKLYRNDSRTYS